MTPFHRTLPRSWTTGPVTSVSRGSNNRPFRVFFSFFVEPNRLPHRDPPLATFRPLQFDRGGCSFLEGGEAPRADLRHPPKGPALPHHFPEPIDEQDPVIVPLNAGRQGQEFQRVEGQDEHARHGPAGLTLPDRDGARHPRGVF
jgi:hypothetical protein